MNDNQRDMIDRQGYKGVLAAVNKELANLKDIKQRLDDQIEFTNAIADNSAPPSWEDVRMLLKFIKTGEQS